MTYLKFNKELSSNSVFAINLQSHLRSDGYKTSYSQNKLMLDKKLITHSSSLLSRIGAFFAKLSRNNFIYYFAVLLMAPVE